MAPTAMLQRHLVGPWFLPKKTEHITQSCYSRLNEMETTSQIAKRNSPHLISSPYFVGDTMFHLGQNPSNSLQISRNLPVGLHWFSHDFRYRHTMANHKWSPAKKNYCVIYYQ